MGEMRLRIHVPSTRAILLPWLPEILHAVLDHSNKDEALLT